MKKKSYLFLLCLLAARGLSAQTPNAAGAWYGKAEVDLAGMHDNYLTELVIKQNGNKVYGIFGYYFRDKYQSFFVRGRYNPQTREVTILNIPVIYYGSNSTVNSIDCNTNFRATLINSKLKSSLRGYFYHDDRYAHMCPDLKVDYTLDREEKKEDSAAAATASTSRIWTPQSDDIVVDAAKEERADSAKRKLDSFVTDALAHVDSTREIGDTAQFVAVPHPATVLGTDSMRAAKTAVPVVTASAPDPEKFEKEDTRKISESFAQRTAVLNKVLTVESDSVRVSFYDNGEIDGDSISVFLNQELILKHQELLARALTLYLLLDSTRDINEISMFAENLGKYPPNTALMVVTDGKNRYEVFMSSSLKENATIKLRRKKPPR